MKMSMDALQDKIRKMKNPTMLGLDPTQEIVPPHLIAEATERLGETPEAIGSAYLRFCRELLDTMKDTVPAVKIQSACFETLGAAGMSAMQEVCRLAGEMGYYVVLDVMRSDAPHIAELFAEAVFGGLRIGERCRPLWQCDAVTLCGYLGSESIRPYLPYCRDEGKNVFLLVKSSNRSGREVQDLLSGDRQVHTAMADLAMRWSDGLFGKYGYSELGVVMGAADSRALANMRQKYDRLFFLAPGYGAQGGTAKPVSAAFDRFGHGAVVSASRSIAGAWLRAETDGTDYLERALEAAVKMKKDLAKYVTVL